MAFKYKYKTNNRERLLFALVIISLTIAIFVLFSSQKLTLPTFVPEVLNLPELSTQGYVEVQPDAAIVEGQGVVILTGECYQLIANTELSQAESIANGIAGRIDFRPNTHDLMKDALNNLGIEVVMVKIVELRNNTYHGRVILRQGDRIASLDSRPSDGIALAVRTNSSIYVKEDLLRAQGKYIC
jgi:bifunctional DNase/RNase